MENQEAKTLNDDLHYILTVLSSHALTRSGAIQERSIKTVDELIDAVSDLLSGWKYIRETHGDLYGVGWDRAQEKAEKIMKKCRGDLS